MLHKVLLKRDGTITTKLTELTVEEVSIVDRPANGRPWSVIKADAVEEQADGTLVIDDTAAHPVRAAKVAESFWLGMSALEKGLDDPTSGIRKALDINESARGDVWSYFDHISEGMHSIASLLGSVDGTPFDGSLDHAVGSEMVRLAYKFVELSREFGVDGLAVLNERHEEMVGEGTADAGQVSVEMAKAGRAMSVGRMRKMAGVVGYIDDACEALHELFSEVGGEGDLVAEIRMGRHGKGPSMKADAIETVAVDAKQPESAPKRDELTDRIDGIEKNFSDGLGKVVQLITDSHGLLLERFTAPVQKSAPRAVTLPGSRQDALPSTIITPVAKSAETEALPFGHD